MNARSPRVPPPMPTAMECRTSAREALQAAIDIRPGSCPNPLNFRSHGLLPVAILGTATFDVRDIDLSSLRMARARQRARWRPCAHREGPPGPHHIRGRRYPVRRRQTCDCHSAGGDGFEDMVLHFDTQALVESLGLACELPGAVVALELTGELLDDTSFAAGDCVGIRSGPRLRTESGVVQTPPPECELVTIRNVGIGTAEILFGLRVRTADGFIAGYLGARPGD